MITIKNVNYTLKINTTYFNNAIALMKKNN